MDLFLVFEGEAGVWLDLLVFRVETGMVRPFPCIHDVFNDEEYLSQR